MTTNTLDSSLAPIVITTNPASGDPVRLGHYLNLGLGPEEVAAFAQMRPAIPGPVAAVLTGTFVGGAVSLLLGVWGAWSANGFDAARVFSELAVMPGSAAACGVVGVALLAVFAAVLLVAVRATARAATVFDGERASLWDASGDSLASLEGGSGEAEDVAGRLGVLAAEANELWPGAVPADVRESFAAAGAALAAGSAGEASRVLDGVVEVLAADVSAPSP
jgi:hypothetical protein